MAGKEKPMIVIKKVIVVAAGHHGGSWKVALADFMTAMMAFFLVMWLLGQSDQTKKAISDYFSTPSVIEYNFQNFGVEITLEKLFLDLTNEPLKAIQSFMEPADKTPNVLDFGSSKVIEAFIFDKMQDYMQNLDITQDGFEFEIPDKFLFINGTAKPKTSFIAVTENLTAITTGLEDSEIKITSSLLVPQVDGGSPRIAVKVASERLDLVKAKVKASLEHNTVAVSGKVDVRNATSAFERENPEGFIKISMKQKAVKANGLSAKPIEVTEGRYKGKEKVNPETGGRRGNEPTLKAVSDEARVPQPKGRVGQDPNLQNPVDEEFSPKKLGEENVNILPEPQE